MFRLRDRCGVKQKFRANDNCTGSQKSCCFFSLLLEYKWESVVPWSIDYVRVSFLPFVFVKLRLPQQFFFVRSLTVFRGCSRESSSNHALYFFFFLFTFFSYEETRGIAISRIEIGTVALWNERKQRMQIITRRNGSRLARPDLLTASTLESARAGSLYLSFLERFQFKDWITLDAIATLRNL